MNLRGIDNINFGLQFNANGAMITSVQVTSLPINVCWYSSHSIIISKIEIYTNNETLVYTENNINYTLSCGSVHTFTLESNELNQIGTNSFKVKFTGTLDNGNIVTNGFFDVQQTTTNQFIEIK